MYVSGHGLPPSSHAGGQVFSNLATEKDGRKLIWNEKKLQSNKSAYKIRQISYPFHGCRQILTVLHSKRIDFEYGVLSAAYTG